MGGQLTQVKVVGSKEFKEPLSTIISTSVCICYLLNCLKFFHMIDEHDDDDFNHNCSTFITNNMNKSNT